MEKTIYKFGRIEPEKNGVSCNVEYDLNEIEKLDNLIIEQSSKLNDFVINNQYILQIKDLSQRIDKALEYIKKIDYYKNIEFSSSDDEETYEYEYALRDDIDELLKILKGIE